MKSVASSTLSRDVACLRSTEILPVPELAAVERFHELAQQVLHLAQPLSRARIGQLRAQALEPRFERSVPVVAEPCISHAEHLAVLLDDHQLPERPLLIVPDHQRMTMIVGQEAVRDLGLEVTDIHGVLVLGETEELDVAAENLAP